MTKIRVSGFIDGFNLYHAIDDLRENHLKWINLKTLVKCFVDPNVHVVQDVYYFSAFATWLNEPFKRHKAYVSALQSVGVTPIIAEFKPKDRSCPKCNHQWKGHEEKQSDVNLSVQLIGEAAIDSYDQAFIISGDSDLYPPIKYIRENFPQKRIKVIAPPERRHSKELWGIATHRASIKRVHLEASLLPAELDGHHGRVFRPTNYDPPSN